MRLRPYRAVDVNEDGRIARSELAAFAGLDARFVEQLREMEETDPDPPTYDRDHVDRQSSPGVGAGGDKGVSKRYDQRCDGGGDGDGGGGGGNHRENDSSMHEYGGDIAEDVSAERAAEHETSLPSESGRESRDGGGDGDFIDDDDDDDDDNSRSFDNDYHRRRDSDPSGRGGGGSVRGGSRGGRNSNSNAGSDGGGETTGHGAYRPGSAREAHHGEAYDDDDANNGRGGGGSVLPPAAAAGVYSAPPINRRRPTSAVADRCGHSLFTSVHVYEPPQLVWSLVFIVHHQWKSSCSPRSSLKACEYVFCVNGGSCR